MLENNRYIPSWPIEDAIIERALLRLKAIKEQGEVEFFPYRKDLFNAFIPYDDVKVVILGQD